MIGVVVARLLGAIPTLLLVSLITFAILHLIPGDPAVVMAGLSATPQDVAQIRSDLGLDQPLLGQLVHWYAGLLHGNLGRSLLLGQDVLEAILQRLPVTLSLSLYGLVLTLLIGVAGGVLAALKQNTIVDQAAMIGAMIGISMPSFFFAPLMVLVFAVHFGWLPSGGYVNFIDSPLGWLRAATLPAVSLALLQVGLLARITRSTMLEVLRQDYVRTARAKGLSGMSVVGKHALANAMIPITTVVGIAISLLLSGSVVIETIFSVPGIGQLLTQAVLNRDYPLVQGGLLVLTTVLVLVNIAVDVAYAAMDPRVRLGG
ncbi:ABC transporter permease [Acidisphaera sp. L21]|uniref:ABC transporter permease n=1 Tax=Acidisphaera sp. L21 TaxID=1641851 RepID=UPI00131EA92A|nr:ABC transporter permease [Acidisphaera sp. L21]